MRLLTATATTQGHRANDFHHCIEGELVMPAFLMTCDIDRNDPDGGCGCGRAFAGLNSQRATTTAIVRDIKGFTHDDLLEAVHSSLEQGGWLSGGVINASDVADIVADILVLSAGLQPGTVLERRLHDVHPRVLATDEPG